MKNTRKINVNISGAKNVPMGKVEAKHDIVKSHIRPGRIYSKKEQAAIAAEKLRKEKEQQDQIRKSYGLIAQREIRDHLNHRHGLTRRLNQFDNKRLKNTPSVKEVYNSLSTTERLTWEKGRRTAYSLYKSSTYGPV